MLCACGGLDHRARSLHVQCDGLLDEQVNAGGRRHFHLAGVCMRRQCDDEQIQLRFVEHAARVRPGGGAELAGERGNFRLIAAAARDELRSIGQRCDRRGVTPRDAAAAEQADAQTTHVGEPKVSTVCSIPGSPASMRANRAGASLEGHAVRDQRQQVQAPFVLQANGALPQPQFVPAMTRSRRNS